MECSDMAAVMECSDATSAMENDDPLHVSKGRPCAHQEPTHASQWCRQCRTQGACMMAQGIQAGYMGSHCESRSGPA